LADILAKELATSVSGKFLWHSAELIYNLGKLTRAEIPKKLILCHDPWTPASGLLTEALKLKRKNIEKAFEKEIKQVYSSKK
jgi:long-subunit acyl-CoA synthetase (AMP-forming)